MWWYRIANLVELLRAISLKKIVIGERLESCGFAHGKAPALRRVRMDVVVAILSYVAGHS